MKYTRGILGQSLNTTAATVLYTVPTNLFTSASLNICNTSGAAANFTVQITKGGITTSIRSNEPLAPAGQEGSSMDLRALLLDAGTQVTVTGSANGVHFTLSGYESPADALAMDG